MKKSTTSERLIQYMKKYNLKQVDILEKAKPYTLEHEIKLNKNDLSQYVSGKVEPGQEKIFILSKALNVDPAWIMGLDVPMRKEEILNLDLNTVKLNKIARYAKDLDESDQDTVLNVLEALRRAKSSNDRNDDPDDI